MEEIKKHIEKTLKGLKDFQLKTVEYTIRQFYEKNKYKMLIADEVGLGKTIVAKGIIAKMYERFLENGLEDEQFNVIYICSNLAIAKQNIGKLNIFTGDHSEDVVDYSSEDDRITTLAFEPRIKNNHFKFRIKALTPATSFDNKSNAGRYDERILLFRLLMDHPSLKGKTNSLRWFLKGSRKMTDSNWLKFTEEAIKHEKWSKQKKQENLIYRKIRVGLKDKFFDALNIIIKTSDQKDIYKLLNIEEDLSLVLLLEQICCNRIQAVNHYKKYKPFCRIIPTLRYLLADVCKEYLKADLFILDEFQRYNNLIKTEQTDDPGVELAREVLNKEGARVLMLSATPFKAYTNDFDELNGEHHYNEFNHVLRFLLNGDPLIIWNQYQKDRKHFFDYLRHPQKIKLNISDAIKVKTSLEKVYRSCIARTERMIVSEKKDAMISQKQVILNIREEDINDFVFFDKIVQHLNENHHSKLTAPLEYSKSCPFPLSFLTNYQHKKILEKHYAEDRLLQKLVQRLRNAWVDLNLIKDYKPIIPQKGKYEPNAKLRLLFDETVRDGGWQYLWIPPSIPYYPLQGAFKKAKGYTKTLIFSSWKMVPRMISSLISYEAERLSIGEYKKERKSVAGDYFQEKKRFPAPLLTYKVDLKDNSLSGMNNFLLNYPSPYLSSLYDPADNLKDARDLNLIKKELREKIELDLRDANIFNLGSDDGDWQKWSWYGLLLLDIKKSNVDSIKKWLSKKSKIDIPSDEDDTEESGSTAKEKHLDEIRDVILRDKVPTVSKITEDQFNNLLDLLTDLTLGSPAVATYRSLNKNFKENPELLISNSYLIASGFISLFNKPESISIIQLKTTGREYYRKVLNYCIDGNIQSMLDEYFYLLIDSNSIRNADELSETVTEILSIKPSLLDIGSLSGLKNPKKKKARVRAHFALDFGLKKINSSGAKRQINVREAFNSPFKPFVLATTSIGQEGLDFHFYCKKILHWNLPSNPIDFEQREGRIHRYKGHIIRMNVASKYLKDLQQSEIIKNPWNEIFICAEKEKELSTFPCDLIPFWHIETETNQKIERIVPLYPFSNDVEKYHQILKILAFYRFTFGQPRQDELIHAIDLQDSTQGELGLIKELLINLSPIKYNLPYD